MKLQRPKARGDTAGRRRLLTALVWVFVSLAAATAGAAESSMGHVDRQLVGWTSGDKLVVRVVSEGERMVDGRSRDFYFRLTEIRKPQGADLIRDYKYGEATGVAHPAWEEARSREQAEKFLGLTGINEPAEQWASPDGSKTLTVLEKTHLEKLPNTPRGTQWICQRTQRLVFLDAERGEVFVLREWTEEGDRASLKKEAPCPRGAIEVYWHPESTHWAVVREVSLSGAQMRPPEVYANAVGTMETSEAISALKVRRPLRKWVDGRTGEDLRSGLRALHAGELERAERRLKGARSGEPGAQVEATAAFGLARLYARRGDAGEARDVMGKARDLTGESFWADAQTAAIHRRLEEKVEFEQRLYDARQAARKPAHLVRIAELFRYVDIGVANELLVEVLKQRGDGSGGTDYRYAYGLLVEGLIDAGLYEEADVLFEKLDELPPRMQLQKLRASVERTGPDVFSKQQAREETSAFLFEHPAACLGYLLDGRILAQRGELNRARRQFRAASVCNPELPDAHFYLGATALRTGNWEAADENLRRYLQLAVERFSDAIRSERRALARSYLKRLDHRGAVLAAVECESGNFGNLRCRGVVENTIEEAITGVATYAVQASAGAGPMTTVARSKLGEVPAGESRTFVLRLRDADLEGLRIEVGRDAEERKLNRTPAVFE